MAAPLTQPVTKNQMVVYAVLTAVAGVAPALTGLASPAYAVFAGAMGAYFIYAALKVRAMPEGDQRMLPARKMFGFSIVYLFSIFAALIVDRAVFMLVG